MSTALEPGSILFLPGFMSPSQSITEAPLFSCLFLGASSTALGLRPGSSAPVLLGRSCLHALSLFTWCHPSAHKASSTHHLPVNAMLPRVDGTASPTTTLRDRQGSFHHPSQQRKVERLGLGHMVDQQQIQDANSGCGPRSHPRVTPGPHVQVPSFLSRKTPVWW